MNANTAMVPAISEIWPSCSDLAPSVGPTVRSLSSCGSTWSEPVRSTFTSSSTSCCVKLPLIWPLPGMRSTT